MTLSLQYLISPLKKTVHEDNILQDQKINSRCGLIDAYDQRKPVVQITPLFDKQKHNETKTVLIDGLNIEKQEIQSESNHMNEEITINTKKSKTKL